MIEEIGKKITQVGQDAIKGTQKIVDTVTLSAKIADQERALNKVYSQIGEIYYNRFQGAPAEELKGLCEDVTGILAQIGAYEEQVRKVKGIKKCVQCGAEIQYSAAFCSKCGTEVKIEVVEVKAEPKCPNCGKIVSEEMAFCSDCGTKLAE